MEAASSDVGCNEHSHGALPELVEGLLPLALAAITVDAGRLEPLTLKTSGEKIGAMSSADEDQHALHGMGMVVEQLQEQIGLACRRHHVYRLGYRRRRNRGGADLDVGWVPQDLLIRHFHQRDRHSGGEEHGLAFSGQQRQDAPQVGDEAHVHHPVGLVQHQHFDGVEPSRVAAAVVEQPARRRHHDFITGSQGRMLAGHADAAVYVHCSQGCAVREPRALLGGLHGELTSGREDQRSRAAVPAAAETLDQWEQEGSGLAASRLRRGDHIAAGKRKRDYFLLNGRRCLKAHSASGPNESWRKAKFSEDCRSLAG